MKIPVILLIIPLSFGLTAGAAVISTSAKHRAEAVIDGKGSLARFGANTRASVGENGQVQLERGVMLVSSSDGFFRRSPVHVSTPQGTVTVRGSAIVAAMPDGRVKITCLEGGLKGTLGGQSLSLFPGQLITQHQAGSRDTMQVNLAALTTSSPLLGQRFQQAIPAVDRISHQAMSQLRSLVNSGAVTISRSGDGAQQVSGATLQIGGGSGGYTLGGEGLTLSLSPNLIQVARDSSNAVGGTVKVPASSATAVPSTGSSQSVTGSGSGSMPAESRLLISSSGVNLSGGNLVLDAGAANLTKQGASVQMSSGLATQAGGIPPQSPELTPRFVSSGSVSASSGVTNVGSSDIAALLSSSMIPIGTRGVPGNAVPAGNLTLNSGTLILTSQQAAAFLSGGGQVIGAGGTPLTPVTNPDGSLTFSN